MMMPMVAPLYADTLATLVQVPGLYVKERVNLLEVLTGFEVENTFDVSLWNPQAGPPEQPEMGKGAPAFTMKEVSDCCQRQFCGHRRAFSIAMVPSTPMIGTYHPGLESRATMFSHPDALVFNRPFSWQCCCWCRPRVFLSHNTLGRFATISNPCRICSFHFDVHAATADDGGETPVSPTIAGENGAKWYTVRARKAARRRAAAEACATRAHFLPPPRTFFAPGRSPERCASPAPFACARAARAGASSWRCTTARTWKWRRPWAKSRAFSPAACSRW